MFTAAESISLFVVSDNDPHPYRQLWPVRWVPTAPHESIMPAIVVRYAGLEAFESDTLHIPFGSIWIPQKCSHSWMGQHFVNAEFSVFNIVIGARYFALIIYWTDFRSVDGPDEMTISKCKINARDGRVRPIVWVLRLGPVAVPIYGSTYHLFLLPGSFRFFLLLPQVFQILV